VTLRKDYVEKMRAALERLQVKAGLAKLELRDLRGELLKEYDALRDRLEQLGEATEDRFEAVKGGFESAWQAFKRRYEEVMEQNREGR